MQPGGNGPHALVGRYGTSPRCWKILGERWAINISPLARLSAGISGPWKAFALRAACDSCRTLLCSTFFISSKHHHHAHQPPKHQRDNTGTEVVVNERAGKESGKGAGCAEQNSLAVCIA